jgi:hypothetical protein
MPDLTAQLLPKLRAMRFEPLELGEEFVYPEYAGNSILNIPSGLCQLLGIPGFGANALNPMILEPLGDHVRRVVLVLMDALSLNRLQRFIQEGITPIWGKLMQEGVLAPLTSIIPSTTSAALTSLWTGRGAVEHGIMGYEMWLKEYGIVANMVFHSPMSFRDDSGSLRRAGFDPETFLSLPTLGSHMSAHGVKVFAFQHHSIARSGLSQMLYKDVKVYSFGTAADLWINGRQLLESNLEERFYAWIYWGEVDHLSHRYGPDDERTVEEFVNFSQAFERLFLHRLSSTARRDTVLILTADHGQIATRLDNQRDLRHHPGLTRRLHLLPTGENRLMYLYLRPGHVQAVRDYIEQTWREQFKFIDPLAAVQSGLFGFGRPHPHLRDRIGDLIAIARGDAYLWWAEKENQLMGRHGGLSPDEMLVPFLAVRL